MIFADAEFPPLSHIVNWPEFIGGDTLGINKVVLIYFFAVVLTMAIFILGNKKQLVPTGCPELRRDVGRVHRRADRAPTRWAPTA